MKKSASLLALLAAPVALSVGIAHPAAAQTTVTVNPTFTVTLSSLTPGSTATIFAVNSTNPSQKYGIGILGVVAGGVSGIDFELSNQSLSAGDPSFPVLDAVTFNNLSLALNIGGPISFLDANNNVSTTSDPTNLDNAFLITNDVTPGSASFATLTGTFSPTQFRVNVSPFSAAPEPTSLALLGTGLFASGFGIARRRRKAA